MNDAPLSRIIRQEVSEEPSARPGRRSAALGLIATAVFLAGFFAGLMKAREGWKGIFDKDVLPLWNNPFVIDAKQLLAGPTPTETITFRVPLIPYRARLQAFQANPDLGRLPLDLDGTILRYHTEVYRLFLPPEEMKADGISPAGLKALLGTPGDAVFLVEAMQLTEASKTLFRAKAEFYRKHGKRMDELITYHRQVIGFTEADLRAGLDIKDATKRVILTNIIAGATGVLPVTGTPPGYSAYTEGKCKDYDLTKQKMPVFGLPRAAE
jgi:hypothetical protein